MYMMTEKRGIKQERELVSWLNKRGYKAFRIAGSGAGTKEPSSDVVCSDGVNYYIIELKSSSKDTIYINQDQIRDLEVCSDMFGATPLVCANFTYQDYVFLKPCYLSVTEGWNFKITREQAKNIKRSDLRPPYHEWYNKFARS